MGASTSIPSAWVAVANRPSKVISWSAWIPMAEAGWIASRERDVGTDGPGAVENRGTQQKFFDARQCRVYQILLVRYIGAPQGAWHSTHVSADEVRRLPAVACEYEGMGVPNLVTWFHADAPGAAGHYPQVSGNSSSRRHAEIYLRCVDVCVASYRRWNDSGAVYVVLNDRAEQMLTRERKGFWSRCGVSYGIAVNTHMPEKALHEAWQNQFFLFDVARTAIDFLPADSPIMLIDSDCLVRASLESLAEEANALGLVWFEVAYSETEAVNGLSRIAAGGLVSDWTGSPLGYVPAYLGGEFITAMPQEFRKLLGEVEALYRWSLIRHDKGLTHPHEEAHMLSVVDPQISGSTTGSRFVYRVWTQPWKLRDIPVGADDLPVWHLPAEKRTGLARLHAAAIDEESWFWSASPTEWRRKVGATVGVPTYGIEKLARDLLAIGRHRIAKRIGANRGVM